MVPQEHGILNKVWAAFLIVVLFTNSYDPPFSQPPPPIRFTEPGGSIPLQSSVSSSGSFNTTVPIELPPYHGLQPALSIVYDSQGGDGWLGVGWNLTGLLTIRRTSPGKGTPNYNSSDVYYLDGMELIDCRKFAENPTEVIQSPSCKYKVSENYQAYTTKIESYNRIAFDPASLYWFIWDKAGTLFTLEPRHYDSAYAPYAWDLSSIEDTLGNRVVINHWPDTSAAGSPETYINSIQYNGTLIKFYYELRPDIIKYAVGYDLVEVRYRLTTIDITVGGSRSRTYGLTYRDAASERSLLYQIQQYGSDAILDSAGKVLSGSATQPTTFLPDTGRNDTGQWIPGSVSQASWGAPWPDNAGSLTWQENWTLPTPLSNGTHTVEFRNPNTSTATYIDIDYITVTGPAGSEIYDDVNTAWIYTRNWTTPTRIGPYANTMHLTNVQGATAKLTFTGTQFTVYFARFPDRGDVQVWIDGVQAYTFNENGGVPMSKNYNDASDLQWNAVLGTQRWFPGDIDGDGRQDFMNVFLQPLQGLDYGTTDYNFYSLRTARSNPDGTYTYSTQQTAWNWWRDPHRDFFRAFPGDVNGDGKSDFMLIGPNPEAASEIWIRTAISNGDGTFEILPIQVLPVTLWSEDNPFATRRHWFVGDANGDGKSDLLFSSPEFTCDLWIDIKYGCKPEDRFEHAHLFVGFSNGDGTYDFGSPQETDWSVVEWDDPHWFLGDANGDGKSDFMRIVQHGTDSANRTHLHAAFEVALSKGDGTFDLINYDTRIPWKTFDIPIPYRDSPRGTDIGQVGDFNGDGKTDFLFISFSALKLVFHIASLNIANTYDITTYESNLSVKYSNFWTYLHSNTEPKTPNFATRWFTGDFNGDHTTDLAIIAPDNLLTGLPWPATVSVKKLISDKKGGFEELAPESTDWVNDCYRNPIDGVGTTTDNANDPCINDLMFTTFAADVNGDGKSDVLYAGHYQRPSGPAQHSYANLRALISKNTGLDTFRWTPTDVNGDQYNDLVYIYNMNPGIRVNTLLQQSGGTFSLVSNDYLLNLTNPSIDSWKVMDVGGPNGGPDGKADLVHISTFPTGTRSVDCTINNLNALPCYLASTTVGTRIYTLLSNGDGSWEEKPPHDERALNVHDTLNWQSTDVNGDGKQDLVYVSRVQNEIRIETLISNGNGTWSNRFWPPSFTGGTHRSFPKYKPKWMPVDVNGDGKLDLVNVDYKLSSGLTIQTLFSNGDGTWKDSTPKTPWPGFTASDTKNWRPMDINGDGKQDLVHTSYEAPGMRIHTLISTGSGDWLKEEQETWKGTNNTSSDVQNWRAADINGDGRTDLIHMQLSHSGDSNIETLISKGGGHWTEKGPWAGFRGTSPDAVFWNTTYNGASKAELLRVDYQNPGLRISSATSAAPFDLLRSIENGIGGEIGIQYRPAHIIPTGGSNNTSFLPLGVRLNLVGEILTAYSTLPNGRRLYDNQLYVYEQPHWSYITRGLLAWQNVKVTRGLANNRPRYTVLTKYRTHEEGIVLLDYIERKETTISGGARRDNSVVYTQFVYPTIGTTFPYRANLVSRMDFVCNQITGLCQRNQADFTPDEFGNIVQILEYGSGRTREQRTTRFAFNPNTDAYIIGHPISETVFEGLGPTGTQARFISYCYDNDLTCNAAPTKGLLTDVTVFNDNPFFAHTKTYKYDSYGNLEKVIDPSLHETTISYDPVYHLFPETVCNALNQCSTYAWDYPSGQMVKVTDANKQSTRFDHDKLGRLKMTTFPNDARTHLEYRDFGNPTRQRIREWSEDGSPDGLWTEVFLDGLGRTYRITKEGDLPGTAFVQDTTYSDSSSQAFKQSHWYQLGSETPVFETFAYDGFDRLFQLTHPDRSFQQWTYDNDSTETWVIHKDEENHERAYYQDAHSRTTKVRETNAGQHIFTDYQYDVLDRLTTITDSGGNVTEFLWDVEGNLLNLKDPDRGDWSYLYDDAGNLILQTDARGFRTKFTYDELNRLKTKQWNPPHGATTTWNYDEPGHGAGIGRLTSISDPTGRRCGPGRVTEKLTYNAMGQVTDRTKCVYGKTLDLGLGYDTLGRLKTVTYPDNEMVTYSYDLAGRLYSLSNYLLSIGYNAAGQVTAVNFPNGLVESYSYSPDREWLERASVGVPGITCPAQPCIHYLYNVGYEHYRDGLIKRTTSSTNKMNIRYTYDDLHRLTLAEDDLAQNLHYDPLGNILDSTRVNGSYTYPPSGPNGCGSGIPCDGPHAVQTIGSNQTYAYDANGNMKLRNGRRIIWNYDNQPTAIQTQSGRYINYDYDTNGERVYKRTQNDTMYYFGPFFDYSQKNGLTKYYYAGSRMVARSTSSGTLWYHQDHLNSTRLLTDDQGGVMQRYDYRPFGENQKGLNGPVNDIEFTGHRSDDESSLIYMKSRYYDPQLGRFISPDSIIPDPFNPQALNTYSYANNNPISYNDPTGHQSEGADPEEPQDPDAEESALSEGVTCDSSGPSCVETIVVKPPAWGLDLSESVMGGSDITPTWGLDLSEPVLGGPDITPTWGLDLATIGSGYLSNLPGNPEFFGWFAREIKKEVHIGSKRIKASFELSGEVVFIQGINKTGSFRATIGAGGGSLGLKVDERSGYFGPLGGREEVTQNIYGTTFSYTETEPIILIEGGYGSIVVGAYQTGYSNTLIYSENTGLYLGVHGGLYSAGIGLNFDAIRGMACCMIGASSSGPGRF